MGLETLALTATLVTSAASTAVSYAQGKRAEKAQREANKISESNQLNQDRIARRRAAREERIKRARIISSATSNGAGDSSGKTGAISALSSNYGQVVAQQSSEQKAAKGITKQNNRIASAESTANTFNELNKFAGNAFNLYNIYNK